MVLHEVVVAARDVVDVAGGELVGGELVEDVALVGEGADGRRRAGAMGAAECGEADGVAEIGEVEAASVEVTPTTGSP